MVGSFEASKMHKIERYKEMDQVIELLYLLRLWQRDNTGILCKIFWNCFHIILYVSLPVAIAVGSLNADDTAEMSYLIALTFVGTAASVRLIYVILSKKEILHFVDTVCVHSIENVDAFERVNSELRLFMKLMHVLAAYLASSFSFLTILSVISEEPRLQIKIGFLLDWRNDSVHYWITFVFVTHGMFITCVVNLIPAMYWYCLVNYRIKYELIGEELKNLRRNKTIKSRFSDNSDLISVILKHKNVTR